jgi:hypothetical protein
MGVDFKIGIGGYTSFPPCILKPRFGGAFFALRKARSTVARGAHKARYSCGRIWLGVSEIIAWAGWVLVLVVGPNI